MNKVYSRINWEDEPSILTPLNEANLNRMDVAIDEIDNRVIQQETRKLDKTEASNLLLDWHLDESTGVITITKKNGEQVIFDLNIEKIPVSFKLSSDGILTMVTDDGTRFTADIASMIPILTFESSETILVATTGDGANKVYSFAIKDGSVTAEKLQVDYLADIKTEAAKAQASQKTAAENAVAAESFAHGGTGTRENEDADNAKEYARKAKESAEKAAEIAGGNFIPDSQKGVAEGVATLDSSGKIPESQLPELDMLGKKDTAYAAERDGNGNSIAGTYAVGSGLKFFVQDGILNVTYQE